MLLLLMAGLAGRHPSGHSLRPTQDRGVRATGHPPGVPVELLQALAVFRLRCRAWGVMAAQAQLAQRVMGVVAVAVQVRVSVSAVSGGPEPPTRRCLPVAAERGRVEAARPGWRT